MLKSPLHRSVPLSRVPSRGDSSRSRVGSRSLAALLHRCVETTENVAMLCLGGLRKSERARNGASLVLLALGDTVRVLVVMVPCSNAFLLNMMTKTFLTIYVKSFVKEGLVPVIRRFLHHSDEKGPHSLKHGHSALVGKDIDLACFADTHVGRRWLKPHL